MRLIQIKPFATEVPPQKISFEIVKLSNNQKTKIPRPLSAAIHITTST
jgi:hypothetical protein